MPRQTIYIPRAPSFISVPPVCPRLLLHFAFEPRNHDFCAAVGRAHGSRHGNILSGISHGSDVLLAFPSVTAPGMDVRWDAGKTTALAAVVGRPLRLGLSQMTAGAWIPWSTVPQPEAKRCAATYVGFSWTASRSRALRDGVSLEIARGSRSVAPSRSTRRPHCGRSLPRPGRADIRPHWPSRCSTQFAVPPSEHGPCLRSKRPMRPCRWGTSSCLHWRQRLYATTTFRS